MKKDVKEAFIRFYKIVIDLEPKIDSEEIKRILNEYYDLYYETRKRILIENFIQKIKK